MIEPNGPETIEGQFREHPANGRETATPATALALADEARLAEIRDEAGLEAAIRKWKLYQRAVKELLDTADYQDIEGKRWKKKSAWKKLAKAFRVSVETTRIEERYIGCGPTCPNSESNTCMAGHYEVLVTCRAIDADGLHQDGTASCIDNEDFESDDDFETRKKAYAAKNWRPPVQRFARDSRHDVLATAETRAAGRAISNLIAAGEVSAEEVNKKGKAPTPPPAPASTTAPTSTPPPAAAKPAAAPPSRPMAAPTWAEIQDLGNEVGKVSGIPYDLKEVLGVMVRSAKPGAPFSGFNERQPKVLTPIERRQLHEAVFEALELTRKLKAEGKMPTAGDGELDEEVPM